MTYIVELTEQAESDLDAHIKAGNKTLLKKIARLIGELVEHPQTGAGKPKPLKYDKAGVWSRRIDDKHRMLYIIDNEIVTVFVISLWGHYDDK